MMTRMVTKPDILSDDVQPGRLVRMKYDDTGPHTFHFGNGAPSVWPEQPTTFRT